MPDHRPGSERPLAYDAALYVVLVCVGLFGVRVLNTVVADHEHALERQRIKTERWMLEAVLAPVEQTKAHLRWRQALELQIRETMPPIPEDPQTVPERIHYAIHGLASATVAWADGDLTVAAKTLHEVEKNLLDAHWNWGSFSEEGSWYDLEGLGGHYSPGDVFEFQEQVKLLRAELLADLGDTRSAMALLREIHGYDSYGSDRASPRDALEIRALLRHSDLSEDSGTESRKVEALRELIANEPVETVKADSGCGSDWSEPKPGSDGSVLHVHDPAMPLVFSLENELAHESPPLFLWDSLDLIGEVALDTFDFPNRERLDTYDRLVATALDGEVDLKSLGVTDQHVAAAAATASRIANELGYVDGIAGVYREFRLGEVFLGRNRLSRADKAYQAALERYTKLDLKEPVERFFGSRILERLGDIRFEQGKWEQAMETYRNATSHWAPFEAEIEAYPTLTADAMRLEFKLADLARNQSRRDLSERMYQAAFTRAFDLAQREPGVWLPVARERFTEYVRRFRLEERDEQRFFSHVNNLAALSTGEVRTMLDGIIAVESASK